MDVVEVDARLVAGDTWVTTSIRADVVDAIDAPPECGARPASRLEITRPGGVVTVRGVEMRVGVGTAEPMSPGRRYLVELGCSTSPPGVGRSWKIDGGRLRETTGDPDSWTNLLEGRSLPEVVAKLRQLRSGAKRPA